MPLNVRAASAKDCTIASVCVQTSICAAVPAVDPDAGEGREQERGNLAGEADVPSSKRGAGEAVDQPDGGDARHPGADERDALSAEEEPEVAMLERTKNLPKAASGGGLYRRRHGHLIG